MTFGDTGLRLDGRSRDASASCVRFKDVASFIKSAGASDRVEFVDADVPDTGLPDGAFAVVWALESIVHVRDKRALRETHRLLRLGWRLVIAEYLLRDPPLSADEDADVRTWCERWAMAALLSGDSLPRPPCRPETGSRP